MKNLKTFEEFLNEMLITPNNAAYLDSVIEFVKEHKKPANDKEFTEEVLDTLKIRRTQNIGKVADIYKNLIDYVNSLLKSKTYIRLNESVNESLEPDTEVKRGDIVTIYGKRQDTSSLGDASFVKDGRWIGNKQYELEIIVSNVNKSNGRNVIYKSYFLDGKQVPSTIVYWYNTKSGEGEKYLKKFEK